MAGAEIGNRAGARESFRSFQVDAERLGDFIERFAGCGALCEFVGFAAGELDRLLLLVIGEDAVVNFGEGALMGGLRHL